MLVELRSSALDGKTAPEEEPNVPWRDHAEHVLVMIEGLIAAADRIRAVYFRNSEILYTEYAEPLDACRKSLRFLLETFEGLGDGDDPLLACLDAGSCPQDRDAASSRQERDDCKRIEERVVEAGKRMASELVRDARFDALVTVRDKDAARRLVDDELDRFFS